MFNLAKIFAENAATHYDYSTGDPTSRWPLYVFTLAAAILAALAIGRPSSDFLAGALSAEAILVGFSFNVLFYLVANRRVRPLSFVDIEHEIRFQKLSKLSDEIFSNVSYFNVVAIFSALLSLCGLMIVSENFSPNANILLVWIFGNEPSVVKYLIIAKFSLQTFYFSILFVFLIESATVFLRTVGRVGYYFTSLKLMDTDAEIRL